MSNTITPKGEATLLQEAREKFVAAFNREPTASGCAPGRVNLIGEHVDYCEGFVLPLALPFLTLVVGAYNSTEKCNVISLLATGEELETTFPSSKSAKLTPSPPAWSNYVKGVVANFPVSVSGFDAVIVSDVPMGAGVSSSASIEVAFFTFLESLTEFYVELVKKAKCCQKAEHDFPGMPCGIMDQYVVTLGIKDHALLIDCRSLEATHVPFQMEDATVLVINSNVRHQLTGTEYPQRRAQCQKAAELLGLSSLRDAKKEDLEVLKKMKCEELVIMRAKHVIEEISRTEQTVKELKAKQYGKVGELFYQSHDSLSQLMQVSCEELDQLVDILREAPGVYGARMTGGGFGGCVVSLVKKIEVENLKRLILSQYKGKPVFFECQPSDGARFLKLQ